MKNYNKILEAVNRGIKLALDDFENDEPNSSLSQKSDIIDSEDVIKQKIDLMKECVDLELPSGTLWCKYNLGVDSNQLTVPEDWYGWYYAWGELEPKDNYVWKTYKFAKNGVGNDLTKYCTDSHYGAWDKRVGFIEDHLTKLRPEDDAAYQNMHLHNYKFSMPTKEQFEELINYTSNYWVKNYNPNKTIHDPKDDGGIQGLNGRVFVGKNANQLFIPAAGYRYNSNIGNVGHDCYLWSSSLYLNNPDNAYYLYVDSVDINVNSNLRYDGYSIRSVINL